ncbi:MAG: hypothetical protein MUP16_11965 [Sedimentisphaerales bacterium]|nr:hypothetical protein [Sedimentisphaerales bacterium]
MARKFIAISRIIAEKYWETELLLRYGDVQSHQKSGPMPSQLVSAEAEPERDQYRPLIYVIGSINAA